MEEAQVHKIGEDALKLADVFAASIPKDSTCSLGSVVFACLTLCVWTAKKAGMNKIEIQKIFVSLWDKTPTV